MRFFWRVWFHIKRAFAWNLQTLPLTPAEQLHLQATGAAEPLLQRYLAWRSSVLKVLCLPVFLLALLDTLDNFADDDVEYNAAGLAWLVAISIASYAMPLAALAALWVSGNLKRSARLIAWGWNIAFLVPLALLLVPFRWLIDLGVADGIDQQLAERFTSIYVGLNFFGIVLIVLPVLLLSISFGVQRACFRLKTLLPESSLPGLFLAAAVPVLPFFVLPFFVLLLQVASSPLLIAGMLFLMAAPLIYLVNAKKIMQPLPENTGLASLRRLQLFAKSTFWLGIGMLLLYALVKPIPVPNLLLGLDVKGFQEKTLLGLTEATSFFRPWNWILLRWFVVEVLGRSLLTMILISDLILRTNAFVWKSQCAVANSPWAKSYDELMEHLGTTI